MKRLLYFFFLPFIIIQSFSVFATVTTSTDTVTSKTSTYDALGSGGSSYAATNVTSYTPALTYYISGLASSTYSQSSEGACKAVSSVYPNYTYVGTSGTTCTYKSSSTITYQILSKYYYASSWTCPNGGSLNGTATLCTNANYYTCPSGGTLSGSTCTISGTYTCNSGDLLTGSVCSHNYCDSGYTLSADGYSCTKQTTTDTCESLKGTTIKVYTTSATQSLACMNGCAGSLSNMVYATFGNGSTQAGGSATFTYSGATSNCQEGQTDSSSNSDYQQQYEAALQAALEDQYKQAVEKCGKNGYDVGTSNGQTVYTCKVPDSKTTTTSTTTNPDGSISTTETTTTNTGATGTACNIDLTTATMSCSGGSSGTSSTTSKNTGSSSSTTTNPDGSTTQTTTETETGDGVSAGTFTAKEGKDYLADLFSSDDIAQLKSDTESLQAQISDKLSEYSNSFGDLNISMSGSYDDNKIIIKGQELDLSGKSLFDRLSENGVPAMIYLVCVILAIRIVLE